MISRILVVEDDAAIRDAIRELLALERFEVDTAENGQDAIGKLGHGPLPSLILLDMVMPVMNGQEFLAARDRVPGAAEIPVIGLTALQETVFSGVAGTVKKPVDADNLLEAIRTCLEAAA